MEEYKKYLTKFINKCTTIKNNPNYTINRNEEGKIHSHYLGDQYEPAIIWNDGKFTRNYYLFDGDIKDCKHPFYITYFDNKIINIVYYSSERIQNEEPIYIDTSGSYYNTYDGEEILNGYESKCDYESNDLKKFTLLCNEMEEQFAFKFAD